MKKVAFFLASRKNSSNSRSKASSSRRKSSFSRRKAFASRRKVSDSWRKASMSQGGKPLLLGKMPQMPEEKKHWADSGMQEADLPKKALMERLLKKLR